MASVGVDVSRDSVRLARVVRNADGACELVDYRLVPFQANALPGTPGFAGFLRSTLTAFAGHAGGFALWTNLGSYHMNVRHLEVPKVPHEQLPDLVYWAYRREAPFDEADTLFDYEVEEEVQVEGAARLSVTGYTIPRREVEDVRELFQRTGFPLAGVTFPVFAARNLFRTGWVPTLGRTVVYFFLGTDYSRGSIFKEGRFILTRGIKSGLQSLLDSLTAAAGVPLTAEQAHKLLFSISSGFPSLTDEEPGYRMTREEIGQALLPALDRLVRQIERTLEHYHLTLRGERVERIYVSGDMTACQPVLDYLTQQLGVEVVVIDPFEGGGLGAELEPPSSPAERILFSQAVGLALSDSSRTPNLACTYGDRQRAARGGRIGRILFAGALAGAALLLAFLLRDGLSIQAAWRARAQARAKLGQYDQHLDQTAFLSMVGQAQKKHLAFTEVVRRNAGVALVGELCGLTPPEIRLGDIRSRFAPAASPGKKDEASHVEIRGIVSGKRPSLEPALAAYVARLEGSPVFENIRVRSSEMKDYDGGQVLSFTLDMGLPAARGKTGGKAP